MWLVTLIKPTPGSVFQKDYFPRKVTCKREALYIKDQTEKNGGQVKITKLRK